MITAHAPKDAPLLPLLACAGLLLAATPACSVSGATPNKADAAVKAASAVAPAAVVQVASVRAGRFVETVTIQGHTVASADLTYSAEVPGTVESMRLALGQRVRRGQVLARIDYLSLRARADAARASASLQQKTCRRLATLRKDDLVTQERVDHAEAARVSADAALKIALANLKKSVIRARRGGVVTKKFVDSGEYVGPGSPVLQVVGLDELVVQGQLPESRVAAVRRGAVAQIKISALGRSVSGKVSAVLPVASAVSRTFSVRIKIRNPGHAILVGMAATVRIEVRTHQGVVLVPHDVVLEEGKTRAVYVVGPGGKAIRRPVTLGPTEADRVMLRSGIRPGERLVVVGQRELKPGQRVQVVR